MDKTKLTDDLLKVFSEHGLKADGADTTESKDEKKSEGDAVVVASLAESIAKKLTDAIVANKNYNQETAKDLNQHIRSKIFTNFHGLKEIEYPSNLATLTKEEKIVTFFKALFYSKADPNSQQVLRALVEGTDDQGGYLVPEELRTEVFRILPDMAVMRRIARTIPMATDTLKLNTLAARPYAYWTAEYASKSTTSAELGQVTLNPHDLVCLLPVTEQLIADANINIVQFIIELFSEAIATAEDKAFFTGNGSTEPHGISQETITEVAAGGALGFNHVISLLDSVPQRVSQSPKAAFVGNRKVKRILRSIKDTTNNYIWRDGGALSNGETRRLPDTLYGYPFYEQNDLAESELYFGDWNMYIIGDRQSVSVRTTTEGGDAWRRNAMEIKAVERVDGDTVLTSAFAKVSGI